MAETSQAARHPRRGRRLSLDLSVDAVSLAGLCRLFHQQRRHRLLCPHRAVDRFLGSLDYLTVDGSVASKSNGSGATER